MYGNRLRRHWAGWCLLGAVLLSMFGAGSTLRAAGEGDATRPADTAGGPKPERFEEETDRGKWPFPDHGADRDTRFDQVFQAFPHDRSIFTLGSVVSLGWQPVEGEGVHILRYEIFIANNNNIGKRIVQAAPGGTGNPTVSLFTPQETGLYFWQVRAYLSEDLFIPSTGRYFEVIQ